MFRPTVLLGVGLSLALCGGCTPGGQQRDRDFELRKLEGEREAVARQVSEEQAKTLALQKRVEAEQAEWNADRAKLGVLSERVAKLTRANQELERLIEVRKHRPLARPTITASPLPAELDQALLSLAGRFPDRVWYQRERGAVSFANDPLFETGSDLVRPGAHGALQELAGILATRSPDEFEIIVVGHTDDVPITKEETLAKHPSNWHLSVHRAIAVQQMLVRAGLPAARMGVMGYAEYRPVGSDRAQNRRVEVFIVPKGGVQPLGPVRPGGVRS